MEPTTLRAVMAALRKPESGCPWDLKQDHQTLARYLREEAAEVLDALAAHRPGRPGDGGATSARSWAISGCRSPSTPSWPRTAGPGTSTTWSGTIVEKLVRRHPHVFAEVEVEGAEEVLTNWAAIKREEKGLAPDDTIRACWRAFRPRCRPWTRPWRSAAAAPRWASSGRIWKACWTR